MKYICISTVLAAMSCVAFCAVGSHDEWAASLEAAARCAPSDDLSDDDVPGLPNELQVQSRFLLSDAEMRDLVLHMAQRYDALDPAESNKVYRSIAVNWLGRYGLTNDIQFLTSILTNSSDCAQESAMGALFGINARAGTLTNFVSSVVSCTSQFNANIRRTAYTWLWMIGASMSSTVVDPDEISKISAFFLGRADIESEDVALSVDSYACRLNPSYRHSQRRRHNLSRLSSYYEGIGGRPKEIFDSCVLDAQTPGN